MAFDDGSWRFLVVQEVREVIVRHRVPFRKKPTAIIHSSPWAAHMEPDPVEMPPEHDTNALLPELGTGGLNKWGQLAGGAFGRAQAKRSMAMEHTAGAVRRNGGGSGGGGGGSASQQARRGPGWAEFANQLGFNPPDHPRLEKTLKPTSPLTTPLIGQHRATSPPSANFNSGPSRASFESEISVLSELKRGVPSPPQGVRRAPGPARVVSQGQHQIAGPSAPPGPAADFGAAPMPPAHRRFGARRSLVADIIVGPGRSSPGRGDRGAAAAGGAALFGVGL